MKCTSRLSERHESLFSKTDEPIAITPVTREAEIEATRNNVDWAASGPKAASNSGAGESADELVWKPEGTRNSFFSRICGWIPVRAVVAVETIEI